jgi:subtilisin family serine protease
MNGKYFAALIALITMCAVIVGLFIIQSRMRTPEARTALKTLQPLPQTKARHPEMPKFIPYRDASKDLTFSEAQLAELARLKEILDEENALRGEAILRFSSNAAFESFVRTARALGVDVLGAIPRLRTIRVGFGEPAELLESLEGIGQEDFNLAPNYAVVVPQIPELNDPNSQRPLVPFRQGALEWLGVSDNASWGQGVVVAVLDTGIDPHSTFREGQVSNSDLNGSVTLGDAFGHGTAVASLIAGNDPGAPGIAPATSLLSYPITNADGYSDSFTMAQAIFDAVDSGAQIINISLGSQGDSPLVREAVQTAIRNDVIIVAAAGNEGVQSVSYPAAYPGVIGVGAIDATGQVVYFSNTGEGINIAAPGVGVLSAWNGDSAIQFSGTSASTPLVTGALAAIYSQNPNSSFAKATELLLEYSNEAGPPGVDPLHGYGNLNIGRIFDRGTPGIYDVAVASQYLPNPAVNASVSHNMMDIVVENRGTETLYNVELKVETSGATRDFGIAILKAGDISVKQVPVNTAKTRIDGSVQVTSRVTSSVIDRNPADNQLSSLVIVKPGS